MNTIDIQANWPVKVTFNGECMQMRAHDRITITLTEREAELVQHLQMGCVYWGASRKYGKHIQTIYFAVMHGCDIRGNHDVFNGSADPAHGCYESGYAHAERIERPYDGLYGTSGIRLTMDRDVAVTLTHLLECVKPIGKLGGVLIRLLGTERGRYGYPPRFTGTIRWKRRRLKTDELRVGQTYKLLTISGARGYEEWEEA